MVNIHIQKWRRLQMQVWIIARFLAEAERLARMQVRSVVHCYVKKV